MLGMLLMVCGCKNEKQTVNQVEFYTASEDAVPFDAVPTQQNQDGSAVWECTYSSGGGKARFKIALSAVQKSKDDSTIGFGHGRFIAVPESQAKPLLDALFKTLEAKHKPISVKRVSELSFSYAWLGSGLGQLPKGGFDPKQPGNWTAMKIFLTPQDTDDDAEVFLNLNPSMRKGEFATKDPDYGDIVLRQLASVL